MNRLDLLLLLNRLDLLLLLNRLDLLDSIKWYLVGLGLRLKPELRCFSNELVLLSKTYPGVNLDRLEHPVN